MPINKSSGNMYPWIQKMHTHLGGECQHRCAYCYVNGPKDRGRRAEKYMGELHLIESEFSVPYDEKTLKINGGVYPSTIFIEHCNDLFADNVPTEFIDRILSHCRTWPDNTYVFQSKNPAKMLGFTGQMPPNVILGTTIETNRGIFSEISLAPHPSCRYEAMLKWKGKKFLTIEPIMDFDVDILGQWIVDIRPDFVNIGADSKGYCLPEPSFDKIEALMKVLHLHGIDMVEKHNMDRLRLKSQLSG